MAAIEYTVATTDAELYGILSLQRKNLSASLTPEEAAEQGFVTVQHNFGLLRKMNEPYPHVIAKDGETVIGYALVMLPLLRNDIPVLVPMFDQIDEISMGSDRIADLRYVVMGQVCIAKGYRGRGVFQGLYIEMAKRLAPAFDLIITEVSLRNTRSLRAHEKSGFHTIHTYQTTDGEQWAIVALDLRQASHTLQSPSL